MVQEKGTISINTENIFPIIKKFLYSDHEIFVRELVSNAVDATQKMKRLARLGHYSKDLGDIKVKVAVDEAAKTLTDRFFKYRLQFTGFFFCQGMLSGIVFFNQLIQHIGIHPLQGRFL